MELGLLLSFYINISFFFLYIHSMGVGGEMFKSCPIEKNSRNSGHFVNPESLRIEEQVSNLAEQMGQT